MVMSSVHHYREIIGAPSRQCFSNACALTLEHQVLFIDSCAAKDFPGIPGRFLHVPAVVPWERAQHVLSIDISI